MENKYPKFLPEFENIHREEIYKNFIIRIIENWDDAQPTWIVITTTENDWVFEIGGTNSVPTNVLLAKNWIDKYK
jgi:hypothetical protein